MNFLFIPNQTLDILVEVQRNGTFPFRPKLFEFSFSLFKFRYLQRDPFAAQFTFSKMFLMAFDKILTTFGSFLTTYFEIFLLNKAVVLVRETTCSLSAFPMLLAHRSAVAKERHENSNNFDFGQNSFETRISAEISLHLYILDWTFYQLEVNVWSTFYHST